MPYFDFNVEEDISVDEYLSACNSREIDSLVKALKEDGYGFEEIEDRLETNGRGYDAYEFEEALHKLAKNYHSLPKEQTDIIINLAKRF